MYNTSIILDNLDKLLIQKNIPKMVFYKEIGISSGSFGDWRSGRSKPSLKTLNKLSSYFECSVDYLINEMPSSSKNNILSEYDKLDNIGKKKVKDLIKSELSRINNSKNEILCKEYNNENKFDSLKIKTFELPASAGNGIFLKDDVPFHFEQINLRTTPQARRANFAVYVRGDSMEPNYFDGDMVFVKEQPAINNGEIGIFIYNDESYIKKYEIRKDGAYLVSLNEEYPPIKIKQSYNFKCCGLVL